MSEKTASSASSYDDGSKVAVSIVVPVYRGRDCLEELVGEIEKTRDGWSEAEAPFELSEAIFVDDGSDDGSDEVLVQLSQRHSWLRVVTLSRNFGQHPATIAGILHSSGDWIGTLDEDLQHRPEFLTRFLQAAATEGLDIVYAKPTHPVHQSAYRDGGSRLYKRLVAMLSGDPNVPLFNSFRLIRGSLARGAASVCSHETYFDVALGWFSERVATVALPMTDERYQEHQRSGYSFRSLLGHARRLILSSQTKYLRAGALLGLVSITISALVALQVLLAWALDPSVAEVRGWTSLILVVIFFGGVTSVLTSIILEYLGVVLLRIQGKPTYFDITRSSDVLLRKYFERFPAP